MGLFDNPQKKWFRSKLDGVQKTIWDLEFKRFKTREIREEIRAEYDKLKASLEPLDNQIAATTEEEALKGMNDQKAAILEDTERFLKQMKHLDVEVAGSPPTEEYPDGMQGINQQLDALRELQQMILEYIKVL